MTRNRSLKRTAIRTAVVVGSILIVALVLVPQLAGVQLSLLAQIKARYLLLAIALEVAFLLAYAGLTRAVLPRPNGPGLGTVTRINLSTLAVSHLVPGGTAAGTALGYRLFRRAGIRASDAWFALGTQGLGSALVLNVILWITLMASIPLRGFDPRYITAAIVGTVLIGFCTGLVLFLTRGKERAAKAIQGLARRLPFVRVDSVERGVRGLADRLAIMRADRGLMARAFGWATAAWLLDAAILGVLVAAFGHRVAPDGLLIAFALANVLGAIPITPRGLGVVEAVMIPTLIASGTPRVSAVLGVISYRLISFWAPIPFGGAAYLSLRRRWARTREVIDLPVVEAIEPPARRHIRDPLEWMRRPVPALSLCGNSSR